MLPLPDFFACSLLRFFALLRSFALPPDSFPPVPDLPTPDDPAYLRPYIDAERKMGPGFGATLWARPDSQKTRFRVFAEQLDLADRVILDAGCGPGDFAAWLQKRGIGYGRFIGVDGVAPVIEHARKRGLPDAEFHVGDLVTDAALLATAKPEVTVISGTLNTMDLATAIRVLENAWAGCSEALAFNFLSDVTGPEAVPQQRPAVRLPTRELLDWGFSMTWDLVYRQDYFPHGHDGTVVMRKRGDG